MPVKRKKYEEIKACMRLGDVIAFSSNRLFSTVIKLVTSSHVSHVGIVVPSEFLEEAGPDDIVIAEATEKGVEFRSLDSRVRDSDVEMLWWLPLHPDRRGKLNQPCGDFRQFLKTYEGQPYPELDAFLVEKDEIEAAGRKPRAILEEYNALFEKGIRPSPAQREARKKAAEDLRKISARSADWLARFRARYAEDFIGEDN